MKEYSCEIVGDLLPLYVDGVCSAESREIVEGHICECEKCIEIQKNLMSNEKKEIAEPDIDIKQAFKAIKNKLKLKKIGVILASIALAVAVIFSAYMIIDNMSNNHDVFSISYSFVSNNSDNEWQRLNFHGNDVLELEYELHYDKVTLDECSDGDLFIRISDSDGNVVIDEVKLSPGMSMELDSLKNGGEYIVEIKTAAEFALVTFNHS